ncbi:hypothetical protein NDU88_001689 [Pleurodeles waltl]|uniref:Uncharacterized protein n=1 Tax=Pleurodeles waltl TaxID=8319 RepID=A0AAV7NDB5_PLEWA|nr:hypothetical protein NDU88_001689 [Pleurodeles waltl]
MQASTTIDWTRGVSRSPIRASVRGDVQRGTRRPGALPTPSWFDAVCARATVPRRQQGRPRASGAGIHRSPTFLGDVRREGRLLLPSRGAGVWRCPSRGEGAGRSPYLLFVLRARATAAIPSDGGCSDLGTPGPQRRPRPPRRRSPGAFIYVRQ